MALTKEQVDIVKSTAPVLEQHGAAITTVFYRNLLASHPELKNVFSLRNQETGAQQNALAKSVLAYARHIDQLGRLGSVAERIAQKHCSLFIKPEHYPLVGEHLIAAFAEVLQQQSNNSHSHDNNNNHNHNNNINSNNINGNNKQEHHHHHQEQQQQQQQHQVQDCAFTPQVREAWIAAYQQLADLLIGRERQLYNEAGTWQTWRRFRIARKEPDNESVTNFYLEPVDGEPLPQYLPGQYVSLQLPIPTGGQAPAQPPAATAAGDRDDNDGRGHHHHCILQSRQYSLSEAPTPGMSHYCISVKREKTMADAPLEDVASGKVPGIMSNLLHNDYGVGSEVDLSPPRGDFYVDPSDARKSKSPLILLSAGVGAAPLRAILDSTLANPLHRDRPVTWLHTARRSATICFSQHVRNAASKHGNLEASIYVRDLCGSDIRDIIHDFHGALPLDPVDTSLRLDNKDAEYYICGPEAWMLELSHWLESLGVDQERQHLELFRPGSLR